jgi:hypothetical protein
MSSFPQISAWGGVLPKLGSRAEQLEALKSFHMTASTPKSPTDAELRDAAIELIAAEYAKKEIPSKEKGSAKDAAVDKKRTADRAALKEKQVARLIAKFPTLEVLEKEAPDAVEKARDEYANVPFKALVEMVKNILKTDGKSPTEADIKGLCGKLPTVKSYKGKTPYPEYLAEQIADLLAKMIVDGLDKNALELMDSLRGKKSSGGKSATGPATIFAELMSQPGGLSGVSAGTTYTAFLATVKKADTVVSGVDDPTKMTAEQTDAFKIVQAYKKLTKAAAEKKSSGAKKPVKQATIVFSDSDDDEAEKVEVKKVEAKKVETDDELESDDE